MNGRNSCNFNSQKNAQFTDSRSRVLNSFKTCVIINCIPWLVFTKADLLKSWSKPGLKFGFCNTNQCKQSDIIQDYC